MDSSLGDLDSDYSSGDTFLANQNQVKSLYTKILEDTDNAAFETDENIRQMNKRKRVLLKDGDTNLIYKNISKKRRRYISDFYTTLLDCSWASCVIMFSASFYGSWMFFGALYFLICYSHGDFLEDNLQNNGSSWVPCVTDIDSFASSFLFSLETQHTIG